MNGETGHLSHNLHVSQAAVNFPGDLGFICPGNNLLYICSRSDGLVKINAIDFLAIDVDRLLLRLKQKTYVVYSSTCPRWNVTSCKTMNGETGHLSHNLHVSQAAVNFPGDLGFICPGNNLLYICSRSDGLVKINAIDFLAIDVDRLLLRLKQKAYAVYNGTCLCWRANIAASLNRLLYSSGIRYIGAVNWVYSTVCSL
ncbi:hypothetical protein T265_02995 [Opisthorchis viverrini]|uniref:Uncharacterized protein n=1 Tax=Opisthorchis viverrini TaxID=6198 RepID=A0A074ZU86_OPIVI|nr:hypothetical protein T265_02995 [Opisthorchis viverrini]KER30646.1 hypothetical protein T265_02995 [Opisthorchis viverrini]